MTRGILLGTGTRQAMATKRKRVLWALSAIVVALVVTIVLLFVIPEIKANRLTGFWSEKIETARANNWTYREFIRRVTDHVEYADESPDENDIVTIVEKEHPSNPIQTLQLVIHLKVDGKGIIVAGSIKKQVLSF